MQKAEAWKIVEALLVKTAPNSGDTTEGILSNDERDALVVLLDEVQQGEESEP